MGLGRQGIAKSLTRSTHSSSQIAISASRLLSSGLVSTYRVITTISTATRREKDGVV